MDIAYLSAISALAGSVVGGLTTGLTAWISQRAVARAAFAAREMSIRQDLFRDFIVTASKAYGEAIVSGEPEIQEIVSLYAIISKMRVLCSPRTIACADRIMFATVETYFSPNVTIRELHEQMRSGEGRGVDPLREFSEAAREELRFYSAA